MPGYFCFGVMCVVCWGKLAANVGGYGVIIHLSEAFV